MQAFFRCGCYMATNETLIEAEALARSVARESGRPARPELGQRVATQIHVFTALFWTAMFVVHTLQMELANEREDLRTIAARAGISAVAFLLCLPIGAVIRRTLDWLERYLTK